VRPVLEQRLFSGILSRRIVATDDSFFIRVQSVSHPWLKLFSALLESTANGSLDGGIDHSQNTARGL
jgi:hypothetical protein